MTVDTENERLQKYLSRAGVASRRAAERLIEDGRVSVNGRIITELGTKVTPHKDRVELDGAVIEVDERSVYILLNKPQKYICSLDDPEGRAVVTELIPPQFGRVYPVGRLDWDSEGALLLTNDGELTNLMTHPRHELDKTYLVKISGLVDNMDARIERARGGVVLDDGYRTMPASIFRDADTGLHTWFVVTIREGKNRQIRRMFETVGLDVRRLKRIAYGPLVLGELGYGEWRRIEEHEVDALYEAAGGKRARLTAARGRLTPGMAQKQNRGGDLARQARLDVKRLEEQAQQALDPYRGTRGVSDEGEFVSRAQAANRGDRGASRTAAPKPTRTERPAQKRRTRG
jgi:23S rRNA pseudouridine2605 synthase